MQIIPTAKDDKGICIRCDLPILQGQFVMPGGAAHDSLADCVTGLKSALATWSTEVERRLALLEEGID